MTPLIFVATALFGLACYFAGRSGQIRTNAQIDAQLRSELKRMARAIVEMTTASPNPSAAVSAHSRRVNQDGIR